MNFQVPQFIEVEDKIFGPLTFKQFIYLAGGAGLCFIEWVYLPSRFLAAILIIPTAILALALAFYKVNNRPFILIMEAALKFWLSPRLFVWKKIELPARPRSTTPTGTKPQLIIPRLSQSKLKDLAWSLDIQEKIK